MQGNAVISGQGTVTSSNTIIGRGSLGNNAINNFNNNGTVSASGSGSLTIDTDGTFKNNNLIQALSDGTLVLSGNAGGAIVNDGTIAAVGGGRVQLMNNISISGGTLTSALGSTAFFVPGGHTASLGALTNDGDINVAINSTLNLTGTITNNGRIRTNASPGTATYNLSSGTVTINGTGSLALSLLSGANGAADRHGNAGQRRLAQLLRRRHSWPGFADGAKRRNYRRDNPRANPQHPRRQPALTESSTPA